MPPKTRAAAARKTRRKVSKNIVAGQAHIKSTFNNTIVSITDPTGAVISWSSAGDMGFKGSRKSTPYAAQLAAEAAANRAKEHGVRKVDVFVKGPGSGRETAIRSLQAAGLEVGSIQDVTPLRTTAAVRLSAVASSRVPSLSLAGPPVLRAMPCEQSTDYRLLPESCFPQPVGSYSGVHRKETKCLLHSAPL